MPGNIGWQGAIIILIVLLVIFGPKRLPEMGRSLGKGMREFKDSITGKTDRDLEEEDDERRDANAALGRSEETAPVDGEVVPERERSRS